MEVSPDIEKFVLSLKEEKREAYAVEKGWLLIPCSGQIHGIIGTVALSTSWHMGKVLTNHIMRIVPKSNPDVRIGYLQCVLGHPTLGRPLMLRHAFGSSVPELASDDIAKIEIPRLKVAIETEIAEAMEQASDLRGRANEIEDELSGVADHWVTNFVSGGGSVAAKEC